MISTRPYLIRAFYDWIVDNHCTPHIVVNAEAKGVAVPMEYVDAGQIVLNIAMTAVQGLRLGDVAIEFQARFGGRVRQIYAPVKSVLAIYAKENGRGMVFAEDEDEGEGEPPVPPSAGPGKRGKDEGDGGTQKTGKRPGGKPHLTVVK